MRVLGFRNTSPSIVGDSGIDVERPIVAGRGPTMPSGPHRLSPDVRTAVFDPQGTFELLQSSRSLATAMVRKSNEPISSNTFTAS